MFTILSEIDRKTSQCTFLIVREAISSFLKKVQKLKIACMFLSCQEHVLEWLNG